MKHSLDTYIFAIFILAFGAVLAIGGASLFMVRQMMDKTYAIEVESRNVDFVNHLHNRTYSLILAIHHLIVRADDKYTLLAAELADGIDRDIGEYLKHEAESPYPESKDEMRLLEQLRANLLALRQSASGMQGPSGAVTLADWDKVLNRHADDIQTLVQEINQHHFGIIGRKVEKTRHSMSTVFNLYLFFSVAGLALVYLGYRLHSRHVVDPIKRLAEVTGRISAGDLTGRVDTDSRTEIGVLYQAFNAMVERIQSHENFLVGFNRHLELKVQERTRELEAACHTLQAAQSELLRFEKMAMLGQIATSVNHEVRTPLNSLYMNLQLIRKAFDACGKHCDERDNIATRIVLIEQEVLRISDMLEEFVRYARIAPPEPAFIDLNKVVGHVAEMLSERAEQSRVALDLALADPPPCLNADENKLVQALVNLCINAIHAMPEGGRLTLATADHGGHIEIAVADTGQGIQEEDLTKIFQPFFTTKETGLGFGLAIVQRIVEDHGGSVACRSRSGDGTEFTLRLPRTPAAIGKD